ncbi:molybdate ABC transporter substrate-binding protein [Speluncibacter jeojiensis]|uniref:Molybdate ABC transporter substrate-binding protein n=1 Tax=Speluncibacter jeojiensis TaxID=2710754 RepID=A0A9X4REV9_9ACTN|nr:molybdate ABC transporter substrate-binding protein [Corynebacteriales bacterium D3-21]
MPVRRIPIVIVAAAAIAALTAGCGSSDNGAGTGATSGTAAAPTGTVQVFAAASLQEAFTTLAGQFEHQHPGTHVKLNFGASSALALQINQGAPADVFASAAPVNMDQVTETGAASAPTTFARNVMEIAVPPTDPAHVTTVADLARPGVKVALCQPQVPCGVNAQKVFDNARVKVTPVTLESDVKSTLTKVELGEVDAGVVYVTDVRAAGAKVEGVAIPADVNASTAYPIATMTKAPNATGAAAFRDYVLSPAGRQVLVADGFEQP